MPTEPAKQAEEISSISAEGALLAHEIGEDDVTDTFTRVHAEALRKRLAELEPKVQVDALTELLRSVDRVIAVLSDGTGDPRRIEVTLDDMSKRADELAK